MNSIEPALTLESAAVSELKTSRIRHLLVVVEIHLEQNVLQKPLGEVLINTENKEEVFMDIWTLRKVAVFEDMI